MVAGIGSGSAEDTIAVMSHWADEQKRSPGPGRPEPLSLRGPHGAEPSPESDESAHEPPGPDQAEAGPDEEHGGPGSQEARNERALPGIVHSMGQSFGYDFSEVSFLKGMPSTATGHGAKAVASGLDEVALDLSKMDLHTPEGQKILGSELAHVMQKRKGSVEPDAVDAHIAGQAAPSLVGRAAADQKRRDDLEQEADAAGEKVARGAAAHVQSGARAPKNQFFGLGDIWNKAKQTAAGAAKTLSRGADWATDKLKKGADWVGDKLDKGIAWAGDKLKKGADWVGDKLDKGAAWAGDKLKKGAAWLGGKAKKGAAWVSDKARRGASWALGKMKKGAAWLGDKGQQLWEGVKKKANQTWDDIKHGMSQEGVWGFLSDPIGALDRQKAQRELSDRFQVVPDDYQGMRAPNTVTQAEYQKIARTYSDIRLGRGDLTIDASAYKTKKEQDAYKEGALRDIAAMMQTGSGRHEIEQLHNNVARDENGQVRRGLFGVQLPFNLGLPIHRHTTMVPLFDNKGNLDRTNGYAAPDGDGDKREVKADGTLGKAGSGTDVHIRYNPGVNIGDSMPPDLVKTNPWLAQDRSDVLLSHEMNHAIKQTQGLVDPRAVQATDNAQNPHDPDMALDAQFRWPQQQGGGPLTQVEHQAVGIGLYANEDMTENAYRRERRELADKHGVGQLAGDDQMVRRNTYTFYPPAPSAPPPGPGPGSAPGPGGPSVAPPGSWHEAQ